MSIVLVGISVIVLLIILNRNHNTVQGDIGEKLVANELALLSDEYRVKNSIDDMIYVNGYQIDHVVVNDKCKVIYVIETKNWHGYVKGTMNSNTWIINDKLECGNPIIQNELHCKAVRNKYKNYDVVNIIVFTQYDTKIQCKSKMILRLDELIDYIENDTKSRENRVYNYCGSKTSLN